LVTLRLDAIVGVNDLAEAAVGAKIEEPPEVAPTILETPSLNMGTPPPLLALEPLPPPERKLNIPAPDSVPRKDESKGLTT
jgi:hypothetical protein